MTVTVISSLAQFKELIEGDKPVVIDFWATWCGPCKVISPIFEKLSEQFPNVTFAKVDVDEQGDISQEVGIRAMPTFILFKNGNKVKDLVGANPGALQVSIIHHSCNPIHP
ncbi:thioredoxin [Abortiporus biennis]|nr:thioredoxin [Abortiporus biennis]